MGAELFDSTRVVERAAFLNEIAIDLYNNVFSNEPILFRQPRIKLVTNGYFILNACYKNWRIEDDHFTQIPKIAAIQCMAIATFQPFRPVDPSCCRSVAEAKANEMYSLACAAAILGINIDGTVKRDFYLRLLDVLTECRSNTLEPYVVDVDHQIERSLEDYVCGGVHDGDKFLLNNLITIFELFCHRFKP